MYFHTVLVDQLRQLLLVFILRLRTCTSGTDTQPGRCFEAFVPSEESAREEVTGSERGAHFSSDGDDLGDVLGDDSDQTSCLDDYHSTYPCRTKTDILQLVEYRLRHQFHLQHCSHVDPTLHEEICSEKISQPAQAQHQRAKLI